MSKLVICLHTTFRILQGGIILALLVAIVVIDTACPQCSSSQGTTVIQYCCLILVEQSYCNNNYSYTPTVITFTLASTFHVLSPFLIPCMAAFGIIFMLAPKICMVFSNELFGWQALFTFNKYIHITLVKTEAVRLVSAARLTSCIQL